MILGYIIAQNPNNVIDSSFIKDIHAIMFNLSLPHMISNDIENLLYRFKSNNMSFCKKV